MEKVKKLILSKNPEDNLLGYHILVNNYTIDEIYELNQFFFDIGNQLFLTKCDIIYYNKKRDTIMFCGNNTFLLWTRLDREEKLKALTLDTYNLTFSDKYSQIRQQIEFK